MGYNIENINKNIQISQEKTNTEMLELQKNINTANIDTISVLKQKLDLF